MDYGDSHKGLVKFCADLMDQRHMEFKVLDVGCGKGNLEAEFLGAYNVVGLDSSKKSLEYCRKKYPYYTFSRINLESEPLYKNEGELWDYVFCIEVLTHIKNPIQVLGQLLKISKHLIFTCPNGFVKEFGKMPISKVHPTYFAPTEWLLKSILWNLNVKNYKINYFYTKDFHLFRTPFAHLASCFVVEVNL